MQIVARPVQELACPINRSAVKGPSLVQNDSAGAARAPGRGATASDFFCEKEVDINSFVC